MLPSGLLPRTGRLAPIVAALVLAASISGADAADPVPQRLAQTEAARYDNCLNTARAKPQDGFAMAEEWRDNGGGAPAQHCLAVALVGMKQYANAADLLLQIAKRLDKSENDLRADLIAQAGEADIMGDQPAAARDAFTDALALSPKNVDYLIDRGRAYAALGKYWEAIDDFNSATVFDRRRPEPLIYRAAAYRKLDSLDLALEDIQHALQLAPNSPLALLERGDVQSGKGDKAAARADWLRVALIAPNTPMQAAAQANIEKLDVNPGK